MPPASAVYEPWSLVLAPPSTLTANHGEPRQTTVIKWDETGWVGVDMSRTRQSAIGDNQIEYGERKERWRVNGAGYDDYDFVLASFELTSCVLSDV